MDDSRSVHSSGLPVSRAALPSQSTSGEFNFVCRACGGSEFSVEMRPGVEVWLASLRIYQAVGFSDLAGHHNLFTCIRCAAAVRDARKAVRSELIGRLLFAARRLAEGRFTRQAGHGKLDLICADCRTVQVPDSLTRHEPWCPAGDVLRLLEALMHLDDPLVLQEALSCGAESLGPLAAAVAESHPSDVDLSLGTRQNGGAQ